MAEHNDPAFDAGQLYTDMAIEAREMARGDGREEVPGVRVTEYTQDGVLVTEVEIYQESAEHLLGKPRGHYITLDVPAFKDRDPGLKRNLVQVLARHLTPMIPDRQNLSVLVVGLGNWNATPDALGPRVVDRLLVTRHLGALVPEEMRARMRSVAAVAPGVLGTTGIETLDIIRGIVGQIAPDLVVAIDALAARNLDRLLGSVQLADTGIHPGAGVGNNRQSLTAESLGVPVVAIGVCTVVQAMSIAQEAVHLLSRDHPQSGEPDAGAWPSMPEPSAKSRLDQVLSSRLGELMVTPKEIDVLIDDVAEVVSEALNQALQPKLDRSEWF